MCFITLNDLYIQAQIVRFATSLLQTHNLCHFSLLNYLQICLFKGFYCQKAEPTGDKDIYTVFRHLPLFCGGDVGVVWRLTDAYQMCVVVL